MDFPASRELVPEFIALESSPSTNADLVERALQVPLPSFTTVVTTDQTAGRGRLGRHWQAPAGTALAVSVLVAPERGGATLAIDRFGWLPIAAGIAMAETIAEVLPAASTGVKWPNDVLVNGRKVCGILAELLPDQGAVVIGAGVNLGMTTAQLPVATATSLAIEGATLEQLDFDAILAAYLGQLLTHVRAYTAAEGDAEASGLAGLARAHCLTLGRAVSVELPDGATIEGTATALDADARLIVRDAAGRDVTVAAGDVTHARHA